VEFAAFVAPMFVDMTIKRHLSAFYAPLRFSRSWSPRRALDPA
jgi:hypothetical protein